MFLEAMYMLINKYMREELTTEKIIENCKKFRGEEYDYSKVKKWKNGEETKIEVIC